MASKHSKSFFDFKKSVLVTAPQNNIAQTRISLPFKIIIFVFIVSLVLSAIFVGRYFSEGVSHQNLLSDAKEVFYSASSDKAIKTLAQDNPDIKGWLKISNTQIDCAVCQGEDNEFYTNHNQLGKKSRYGALFLSANDTFARKGKDQNIVIFGNNMNDGAMFGELKQYRNLNFYKQNPCVQLYYGDKCENYIVFAIMLVDASSKDYDFTKGNFTDKDDFNSWYKETCKRSIINTTIPAAYGDDLLTLVTSANDFDGARLVVIAKKLDEWEASHTDVTNATVNPKPKHDNAWYDEKGLENPYK